MPRTTTGQPYEGVYLRKADKTGRRTRRGTEDFAKRVSRDLKWNAQQTGERMGKAGSRRGYNLVSYQDKHELQYPLSKGEIARAGGIVDAYNARAVDSSRITAEDMNEGTHNISRRITPGANVAYNMNRQSGPLGSKSKELKKQKEAADDRAAKDKQMLAERARGYKERTGRDYGQDKAKWKAQQRRNSDRAASSLISAGSGARSAAQDLASDMSDRMKGARAFATGREWESPYRMDSMVPVQEQERENRRLEPLRKAVRGSNRKGRYQQK